MLKSRFTIMLAASVLLTALPSCAPSGNQAPPFHEMQAAYEKRIAQLELAYDELNGLLVLADERFSNATQQLEDRNVLIERMLADLQRMRVDGTADTNPPAKPPAPPKATTRMTPVDRVSAIKNLSELEVRLREVERVQDALLSEVNGLAKAQIKKSMQLLCKKHLPRN